MSAVVQILSRIKIEKIAVSALLQTCEQRLKFAGFFNLIDRGQICGDWFYSGGVDCCRVHATCVKIANFLLIRAD